MYSKYSESSKKYYLSSGLSYNDILIFGYLTEHNLDFAGFSESYSIPLICTEKIELIVDGCQYERSQKTERISDWDIAHKYLNVCVDASAEGHNCSKCGKCMRTLIALEAMNKLDKFSNVSDIPIYRLHSFRNKCEVVLKNGRDAFCTDNYKFAIAHGLKLPSLFKARLYFFSRWLRHGGFRVSKKILRKIIGNTFYDALKKKFRHS